MNDVHSYDGLLTKKIIKYSKQDFYDSLHKIVFYIYNIKNKNNNYINNDALLMIKLLIEDSAKNTDNSNKINVEDIIVNIVSKIDLNDYDVDSIMNVFIEQIADIKNGTCPEGRTTRLYQIFHLL